MSLGEKAILQQIYSDTNAYKSTISDINELELEKSGLGAQKNKTEGELLTKNSEDALLKQQEDFQTNQLEEYHELLKETIENEDPMNKLYCGIKEFVIEEASMCGMGMGMGSLQLNSNLQLTGKELVAMDKVLNANTDGQYGVECLVDQLHEMGIDNAQVSASGNEIELTRVDENGNETKVKIKDANGDGMLNGCDYDFSDALAQFNKDLCAYNDKVAELEQNIETTSNELKTTQAQEKTVSGEINKLENINAHQTMEISRVGNEISTKELKAQELKDDISDSKRDLEKAKKEQEEKELQEKKDKEDQEIQDKKELEEKELQEKKDKEESV